MESRGLALARTVRTLAASCPLAGGDGTDMSTARPPDTMETAFIPNAPRPPTWVWGYTWGSYVWLRLEST